MDCAKVGGLIYALRKEKNMTQKQLADAIGVSDRAVSKWERGAGCPDVSLLPKLSALLGVHIEKILSGALVPKEHDGGNMKRAKFYVCPACGNVLFATSEADIACCGRKLSPLSVREADEHHAIMIDAVEDEYFITIDHEMTKEHSISFVACVTYDRALIVKLYPEQNAQLRMPRMNGGVLYAHCTEHGLMKQMK